MNVILYNVLENIFYYTPETLGILLLTHGLLQKKMRFDKTNIFIYCCQICSLDVMMLISWGMVPLVLRLALYPI